MEEVWKDINLGSLHDPTTRGGPPSSPANFRSMIFQDFFARPFASNPPPPTAAAAIVSSDYDASPLPPPPLPPTLLSLNSVSEVHFLGNSADPLPPLSHPLMLSPTDIGEDHASGGRKRKSPAAEDNSVDRRHKRMIKNRESAARSRARKQAYTNELELEVAHLTAENARLRRQQQQQELGVASAAAAVPQLLQKKHILQRTSTAPF